MICRILTSFDAIQTKAATAGFSRAGPLLPELLNDWLSACGAV